jgi:hypothetical protein
MLGHGQAERGITPPPRCQPVMCNKKTAREFSFLTVFYIKTTM